MVEATTSIAVRKQAVFWSNVGAFAAGCGIGASVGAAWLDSPLAWGVAVGGAFAHAVGMTVRHRLDRGVLPRWAESAYRACWILMAAGVIWLAVHSLVER